MGTRVHGLNSIARVKAYGRRIGTIEPCHKIAYQNVSFWGIDISEFFQS